MATPFKSTPQFSARLKYMHTLTGTHYPILRPEALANLLTFADFDMSLFDRFHSFISGGNSVDV